MPLAPRLPFAASPSRRFGLLVHVRAWADRAELDRKLAAGAAPALRPELGLRARQVRRRPDALARSLRGAARHAARPGYTAAVAPNRAAVAACRRELEHLAVALETAADPEVAALARVSRLCTWGGSALFMGPTAALSAQLERARRELEGGWTR